MAEFRLYDDPGGDVAEIMTDGETIKPFLNAVSCVVDEAKIHVDERGLSVCAVDSANVFMCEVALQADAFDTFDLDEETTLGVPIGDLQSATRRARKYSGDELTLSIQERELTATVARGYDDNDVVSQSTVELIDPDTIREEPSVPDLDRDVSLSLDAAAFMDALSFTVNRPSDVIQFKTQQVNQHATALYLSGVTDTRTESIAISNVSTEATCESAYSYNYMEKALGAIKDVDPETVTIVFDDEFPITVSMESEERPFKVRYLIAPRIKQ